MRMRMLSLVLLVFLPSGLPAGAYAFDVNGLWSCTSLSKDSLAIFSQEGDRVDMMLSGYYGGTLVVYYGSGVIEGDRLVFWSHFTRKPPSWRDGRNELTISPDGNTMRGRWFADGLSGELEFVRLVRGSR